LGDYQTLGRPLEKHIDNQELNALVPSSAEPAHEAADLSREEVREAHLHVRSCLDCGRKVWKYWLLVNRLSIVGSDAAPPGPDCPGEDDVNWYELASGLWPEFKAAQLIKHAALCDHCGPFLRAATRMEHFPTPGEEQLFEGLRAKFTTASIPAQASRFSFRQFAKWLAPVMSLIVIAGIWAARTPTAPRRLSGPEIARFAVTTHRRHAEGALPLELRTDSEQILNQWLSAKSSFALALPSSAEIPEERQPYRLQGARFVPLEEKSAAYIAYQMPGSQSASASVSLVVTPETVAVAGGGVEAQFTKVSFHYSRLDGYKVVTWSSHGLTYALVSQEDDTTQRSCMVCHSVMRDRDLSHTSTPLRHGRESVEPVWQ
jgi:anti-sigma factor RsiW